MSAHEPFRYRTLEALRKRIAELGLELPLDDDVANLAEPVRIGDLVAPNRLIVHPMEGCDGTAKGEPDKLTYRRYERFAAGGSGLLWFEATAVVPEARANPRQLLLVPETAEAFRALRERALEVARDTYGPAFRPVTVIQLTHSGRYSRPVDKPAPIIAHHDGLLDQSVGVPPDQPLITDEELDRLQDHYVIAARLAREAGFDAVDLKHCHRYLPSELLAAHTRPGRYGGSFENRTRFMLAIVDRVQAEVPGVMVTTRLNVYDGHPYPWGWGVDKDDPHIPDMSEPLRLIQLLRQRGLKMINVTVGNPYYTPHINRPFDIPSVGVKIPDEHPLYGVARIIDLARQVQEAAPEMVVIGSGYSYLRQYLGYAAAAAIRRGWATMVGLGRGAFAYPNFARDLLTTGRLDPKQVCITCSQCSQIMRDHGRTGCVIRDREIYGPIYKEGRAAH